MTTEPTTTAILLVAGRGTRLAGTGAELSKPLSEVVGRPLLDRMLEELDSVGVERFVLVVGHLREQIESFIAGSRWSDRSTFVVAERFATTNNSMSLLAAGSWLRKGAWIIEGDVVVQPGSLTALARRAESAWLVADFAADMDGCCLASTPDGRLRSLSIRRPPFTEAPPGQWKSVGVVKTDTRLGDALTEHLGTFEGSGRQNEYYDLAIRDLLTTHEVYAEPIGDRFWAEIDTAEELVAVNRAFASLGLDH